jgi:hypothetical protein
MHVFGYSYECYVPDANIIYPHIFLSEISTLPQPSGTYRECLNALRKDCIIKILPESDYDFNRLVLRKFMDFLDDIKKNVLTAKDKSLSSQQFINNYSSLLRQRKIYDDNDCGDLKLYWEYHKLDFAKWLNYDRVTIETVIYGLAANKLQEYRDFVKPFQHSWTTDDSETIDRIYTVLKSEKKKGTINSNAHDEDLKLLAGCLYYVIGNKAKGFSGYLPVGVLYLVTDDGQFFICAQQVKTLEALGIPKGTRLTGFDVIKPRDFLTQYRKPRQK